MAFFVDTATALPTHICINKRMEIKVLLVQMTWHRLPQSTPLTTMAWSRYKREISHTQYNDKLILQRKFHTM